MQINGNIGKSKNPWQNLSWIFLCYSFFVCLPFWNDTIQHFHMHKFFPSFWSFVQFICTICNALFLRLEKWWKNQNERIICADPCINFAIKLINLGENHTCDNSVFWESFKKGQTSKWAVVLENRPKFHQQFLDIYMLQLIHVFYTTVRN